MSSSAATSQQFESISLEAFLNRLDLVKRNGAGWVARCPAHEDKKPSLSVTKRDGKILLHCFAGCPPESVCSAMGIELRSLSAVTPHIVATYDYKDENDALLFQVLRFDPKGFRQRRPDSNGVWIWNLEGVRRVLYRLSEVLGSDFVLVVEGEKDVECARSLKLKATCNAGGAGKWKPEYADCLKGKRVAIIADADEPGRRHAQQVAESLVFKATSIKVLELPGAKDLSEWMGHGGTTDDLLTLVDTTPEWQASGSAPKLELYSCSKFLDTKFSDNGQPLIAGLIDRQSRVLIIGKPKMMKSFLAFNLAFEAACGFRVLGKFITQRPLRTIYGQFEDRRGEVQTRLKKFVSSHNGIQPTDEFLRIMVGRSFDLMEENCRVSLEAALQESKPDLLVLDVMRALFSGDINKTDDVRPFLEYLDTLCEKFKTALVLVHYTSKHGETASAAGSSYLDGWPELLIHVRNKRKLATCTMAELEFRGRSTDLDPINVVYDETATPIFAAVDGQSGAHELSIAKRFLGSGWGIKDLGEVLGCSYQIARRMIEEWLEANKVQIKSRSGRGGKKRFEFVLSDDPDEA
jgi:putative DNA primase/helicase